MCLPEGNYALKEIKYYPESWPIAIALRSSARIRKICLHFGDQTSFIIYINRLYRYAEEKIIAYQFYCLQKRIPSEGTVSLTTRNCRAHFRTPKNLFSLSETKQTAKMKRTEL